MVYYVGSSEHILLRGVDAVGELRIICVIME